MSKLLFAMLLCACQARLMSATYYVSTSGDDSAPGTSESRAWKTLDAVNGFSFNPGDKVLFQGGRRFQGSIDFGADDAGTPEHPFVIASYGQGRATIAAGAGAGFKAVNAAGIEIRNLNFSGSGPDSNTEIGICFWLDRPGVKLDHIVIDGVEVSGFGKNGIRIGSWDASKCGYRDVRVSRAELHHNRLSGMVVFGFMDAKIAGWSHERFHIDHCSFHDNSGDPETLDNHSGSGVVLGDVDGAVIEYCVAFNNGRLCNSKKGGPIGIWAYESNNILIQFNESHHNRIGSCKHDGGGFDLDGGCTNSVMQFNYSHDNDGAGFLVGDFPNSRPTKGNVVRFNISENDARANNHAGIHVYAGSDCQIYNNTVFVGPGSRGTPRALYVTESPEGTVVRNNIFLTVGGVPVIEASKKTFLSGNLDSAALHNPGHGGTIGDPERLPTLKAYTISVDSPLRSLGVALEVIMPEHDFYGNKLEPGVFGVGACVPAR